MCAKESLSGPAVIAYADTLIRADFDFDPQADAIKQNHEAYAIAKKPNDA
jgi:hypothetical protein